jgi:DNA polymerase bacteriophage-type
VISLYFDYETANLLDLHEVGLANYCASPSLRILMCSYAVDDAPVKLFEKTPPEEFLAALKNPAVTKIAWNSPFERNVTKAALGIDVPYEEWIDAQVYARYLSLPGSLEDVGTILGLPEDEAKIKDGKRLIRLFSAPCQLGGEITLFGVTEPKFHDETDKPADWKLFQDYCIRDTETERTLYKMMEPLAPPVSEMKLWRLDQKINNRGLPTNPEFVHNLYKMASEDKASRLAKIKELTQLENPNSNDQMLKWAQTQGYPHASIGKEFVASALAGAKLTDIGREVLTQRQEAAKTSYQKLETLKMSVSADGWLRNQFVFLGAARTGRWSSYGVQVQNLPRPLKTVSKNLERCMELVRNADSTAAEKEFGSVIGFAASMIRSAFQAPKGYELGVCDLNAIENRVLGWVCNCDEILRVFREGRDPYLSFAAIVYNVPYESLIKIVNGVHKPKDADAEAKRQIVKSAVLGCGYGLGPGVEYDENTGEYTPILKEYKGNLIQTGLLGYAKNNGIILTPEQAYLAQHSFREAYPEVVESWYRLESAAKSVIQNGGEIETCRVVFDRKVRKNGKVILRIKLPSGRYLHYLNARIETRFKFGKDRDTLVYDGIGHGVGTVSEADGGQGSNWGPVDTYGGKLMENIVQAIARDLLSYAMMLADEMGIVLLGHFHDELMCLLKKGLLELGLDDLRECMVTSPCWAKDLPLGAEGWTGQYYKKG